MDLYGTQQRHKIYNLILRFIDVSRLMLMLYRWFVAYVLLFCVSLEGLENNIQKSYKEAERLVFQKSFILARTELQKILLYNPQHTQSLHLLGDIYLAQQEYRTALEYYKQVLLLGNSTGELHFRIGQTYLSTKQLPQAQTSFQEAYRLNPNIKSCLFQLGYIALVEFRDKSKTIKYWKKFLAVSPQDYQYANIQKAIIYLEEPDFELPGKNSGISLDEALSLGKIVEPIIHQAQDKKARGLLSTHNNEIKELLEDEGI